MITALAVQDLALARGGRTLFRDLSFALHAGEAAVLSGPNGAGKTSLLRAVAGLLRPAAGSVAFTGEGGPLEAEVARERHAHLLGHHDGLKTGRTAREELGFWTRWLGGSDDAREHAQDAFQLAPLLPLEVRRLSAGQRRRLSLARLLAAPRALWLLDEPLAPLDAARRARFGEVLRAHLDGGGLVLAAAHDPLPVPARTIAVGAARAPLP